MAGQKVSEAKKYKNLTATATILQEQGELLGIFVASASNTPTIKVQDGANTVVNTFTPIAGTFYPLPFRCAASIVVTIGGTVDCTVSYESTNI